MWWHELAIYHSYSEMRGESLENLWPASLEDEVLQYKRETASKR